MGDAKSFHRPLQGGTRVTSAIAEHGRLVYQSGGTLTGLATRNSDQKKVLVTNLHVMTGDSNEYQPSGNEEMYQEVAASDKKVGSQLTSVEVMSGQDNIADVAMCELLDGVEADFGIHSPSHGIRQVIAGVEEPMADDELTVVGIAGGEGIVTVLEVNKTVPLSSGYTFTGAVRLDCRQRPILGGDSGAPCLVEDGPGRYRMCCIVFAAQLPGNVGWAFPASVAERGLGITFGYQPNIKTRSEENMGEPILTSEGFAGRRIIIDDYFQAGETLYAGDVVAIQQASIDRGSHPRIFRIAGDADVRRVIGVVHTPAGKEVGDQMATTGATPADDEYVSIVVQGLAKVLSARAIQVGDPLTPSDNAWYPNGKNTQVARVGLAATSYDAFIGRCLSATSGPNQVADILVDVAGGYDSVVVMEPSRTTFNVPTNLQVAATSTSGELNVTWNAPSSFASDRDYYEYHIVRTTTKMMSGVPLLRAGSTPPEAAFPGFRRLNTRCRSARCTSVPMGTLKEIAIG